ncbi:hypothetical protein MMC21_002189 [Puttea exsequens]|nr:hypothetical protein [Puttea exsequens]
MRSKVSPTPSNPVANRNPDDGYTLEEIATQFDCKHQPGTLNKVFASDHEFSEAAGKAEQSKDDKDGREILTFILLFKHQHPHWPPKIFCKSHLHLLPSPDLCPPNDANTTEVAEFDEAIHALEPAEKSPLSNPIPVFAEELGKGYQTRFLFFGFHVITSVERLEPKSKELIEMLELKFMPQGKERKPEAWAASLAKKWALITLKKSGEGKSHPMIPLKEIPKRGVTEMLQQMRLKSEKQEKSNGVVDAALEKGVGVDGKEDGSDSA